jgi:hypothetical protein
VLIANFNFVSHDKQSMTNGTWHCATALKGELGATADRNDHIQETGQAEKGIG